MPEPQAYPINELATGRYTAVLVGNDGVTPIPGGTLSSLTLTLYAIKSDGTDAIINARNVQNVLNANNVTIDTGGNLVWLIQVGDTTMVENIPYERHIAVFSWVWPGGSGNHEVVLVVKQLHRVP